MLNNHPDISCCIKIFSRWGESFPALDICGTYTYDDTRVAYNVVFIVNSTIIFSDLGEALLESFEFPQYLVDIHRDNNPYPPGMSYNPMFFDTMQYMFICL